ncbi:MAG: L,D-transpeptidase family protein [Lachnospiraceae bacterium]|nr:L,D-transpeptidase family protein [Lachnospiraceae bacterium]
MLVFALILCGCEYENQETPVSQNKTDITVTFTEGVRSKQYQIPVEYAGGKISANRAAATEAVREYINENPRIFPQKAYITSACHYVPPVNGTQINIPKLISQICENVGTAQTLDIRDFYLEYQDPDAPALEKLYSKIQDSAVTYSTGEKVSLYDLKAVYDPSDNSISYDKKIMHDKIRDLANSYDDAGTRTVTINGVMGHFTVSGGTWGHVADTQAEIDYMEEHFDRLKTGEDSRIPIMKQDLSWDFPADYIEVDKELQHVYVVSGNAVIMDTDCVTGKPNGHATPEGIFFISETRTNKTLTGPGYSSFVYRWMRLTNSGIGLHDATWRGRFGGAIYERDGSHGCINLPKAFAYDLYDFVRDKEPGDIVVFVHN